MNKMLIYSLLFFSVASHAQQTPKKRYKNVSTKYADSILRSIWEEMQREQNNYQSHHNDISYKPKQYKQVSANINEAKCLRISFTAQCTGDNQLYAGRVTVKDTVRAVIYSFDNINIAGINTQTKIGNDLGAVRIDIAGHEYYAPIVEYDKDAKFEKLSRALNERPRVMRINARIILSIRGRAVVPVLLIDNIIEP